MLQLQYWHLNAKIFSFLTPNRNIPLFPQNLSHSSSSVKIRSTRHLVNKSVSEKSSSSFDMSAICFRCSFNRSVVTRRKSRYYDLALGLLMFVVGVNSSERDLLEAFKRPATISDSSESQTPRTIKNVVILDNVKAVVGLVGAGLVFMVVGVGPASTAELPLLASSLQLSEPANALSLPTWVVHISSVVEWYPYLVEHFVHAHGISFIIPSLLRYWWPFKLLLQ
ncbi:uncharacterized protein LOC123230077 isoform X2 [Mangifera indica]|uniref:uncharacterized protein LOC123230077 isoform X2 n=1 Tax=Mangifera indica TaxID=29780 RepID=UPI001CFACCC7|nr:uncharacterized protein LOC123230077 isoform X2 [Mangifera indica]